MKTCDDKCEQILLANIKTTFETQEVITFCEKRYVGDVIYRYLYDYQLFQTHFVTLTQ